MTAIHSLMIPSRGSDAQRLLCTTKMLASRVHTDGGAACTRGYNGKIKVHSKGSFLFCGHTIRAVELSGHDTTNAKNPCEGTKSS